jgi:HD-GYP domain-containing protein (c-di-GMP phosphodiesterase class II)
MKRERAMDELLQVEEIEELEPLEDLVEFQVGINERPSNSPLLLEAGTRSVIQSYESIPEPLALLDGSLGFVYRNGSFRELLKAFGYPESSSFLGTLSRSINNETARSIYESVGKGAEGYSWKGTLQHKAKSEAAVITKVHIFPLWPGDDKSKKPPAYSVYLDDVTEENRKFLRDMFSSLLEASKLKDNDTGLHIERVNLFAARFAKEIYNDSRWPDVDKDFIEDIGFLAAMHDVGKIGTPDDILNKEGPLNEFEWGIMKEHTKNGAFILSSYPNPMAKEIALSHHEWWNGTGYPYNLEGTMIPLPARIVTLADVYDALRMKRSYKTPFTHAVAIQKIVAEKGVHFDPGIVDIVLRIEGELEQIFADNAD